MLLKIDPYESLFARKPRKIRPGELEEIAGLDIDADSEDREDPPHFDRAGYEKLIERNPYVFDIEGPENQERTDYYNPDEIDWISVPGNYARGILGFTDREKFIALVEEQGYQTWLKTREHEMVHFPYANESRVRELTLTGPKYCAP